MPTSIGDVLAQAQPRVERVSVCLRGDLVAAHERAQEHLERLITRGADDADQIAAAEAVKTIEADIAEATVEFVFQSIGRAAWTALLMAHPPTDEQKAANPRGDHNPETFPHAAIAASCVAPADVTIEAVAQLEELNVDLVDQMWNATLAANLGSRFPGESAAASAVLRRLRPSSEQRSDSASGEASSSDA